MASHEPPSLESGDLTVSLELREVRNARGESARLGPVNMKVLALLLSRPGQVVSRTEIFASVWRNQLVGDDVLTRAISDIRAEISRLGNGKGLIETLPKRGYRWTADVRQAASRPPDAAPEPLSTAVARTPPVEGDMLETRGESEAPGRHRLLVWVARGSAYAAVLVLLATLGVWLLGQLARPHLPIVAVLPIVAEPSQRALAERIEQRLSNYLLRLEGVDLLAHSAVESRPANPFPYFYYEFGASWLIEAELRPMSPATVLTVDLVDARTGIVLFQSSAPIEDDGSPAASDFDGGFAELGAFFEAQGRR